MNAGQEGSRRSNVFPKLEGARYSHALERGLAILGCFTPQRPVLGISEIAEELGISRATTHRYVSTLVAQGHLARDESRRYKLASGTIELGMATLNAIGLCQHARPYLRDLAERTRCTSEIAVLDGSAILVLASVTPSRDERRSSSLLDLHRRLPIHCTSMGKTLLAHLPERPRRRLIDKLDLQAHTARTITTRQSLVEQLELVRRRGIALNDEELEYGSCAIASPVRDRSGDVVAAINLVAANGAIEAEELRERDSDQLIAGALRLSNHLGWPRP